MQSPYSDGGLFLRVVLGIPLVQNFLSSHAPPSFSTRENKSMTPEEFMAPGAEPDRIDGDLSSVWVETRWGLAAVIIAACLVALGAFYYVVACFRIN